MLFWLAQGASVRCVAGRMCVVSGKYALRCSWPNGASTAVPRTNFRPQAPTCFPKGKKSAVRCPLFSAAFSSYCKSSRMLF